MGCGLRGLSSNSAADPSHEKRAGKWGEEWEEWERESQKREGEFESTNGKTSPSLKRKSKKDGWSHGTYGVNKRTIGWWISGFRGSLVLNFYFMWLVQSFDYYYYSCHLLSVPVTRYSLCSSHFRAHWAHPTDHSLQASGYPLAEAQNLFSGRPDDLG